MTNRLVRGKTFECVVQRGLMTTVGYGDMTPYYEHGRALAV